MEYRMKTNLAYQQEIDNEITLHPSTAKKIERQAMSEKFSQGYVQSSQLYRKEVYPFLSDAARHVYFELENRINGFQKDSDFVSYSQLQGNAELEGARVVARASISKGLKELIEHGVITVLATGKKGNKYQINEVSLLGKQYTKKTSSPTGLVHVVDQSSLPSRPQLVHVVDTQKKDLKKYIKESSSGSKKPFFEAQKNVMASYVTYFMDDTKYYSLFDLEQKYSVDQDFINQATASYPSLELSIDNISAMFDEMRQWSLTQAAGKKQPQQWMNTWLNWVKNNSHKFLPQARKSKSYQPTSSKNSKTMQDHDEFFAQYGIGSNFQESDFIDVHQSEIKTIGGSDQ